MEGYNNERLTVDGIREKITSTYPYHDIIVIEGYYRTKEFLGKVDSTWGNGFLCGKDDESCLNVSNGKKYDIEDNSRVLCEGVLKAEVEHPWQDLGNIVIKQAFEIRRYIDDEELIGLLNKKSKIRKPVIWETLRKSETKPRVCLVSPKSKATVRDFGEGIQECSSMYEIDVRPLPYYGITAEKYCKELELMDDHLYDVICFLSGGRDSIKSESDAGYGVLHDADVLRTIANMQTPTIGAIGHSNAYHLFDMAFTDSLGNSGLLGVKLREILG